MSDGILLHTTLSGVEVIGRLSDDALKVFLDAKRSDGRIGPLLRADILALLSGFIDQRLIDVRVIDDVLAAIRRGEREVIDRRVAQGRSPIQGRDGALRLFVKKLSPEAEIKTDPNAPAKLTQVYRYDNVEKGQVIGELILPSPGEDGEDVFGNRISGIAGLEYPLHCDGSIERIRSREDGVDLLVAKESGCLTESEYGMLSISSRLVVASDVDFHWGDIEFLGAVKVVGDVMPGFDVIARQGIEIVGSVRGGSLISTEGDIRVWDFVFGGPGSLIRSGRTFTATMVQEVNTEVSGDIVIRKEATNSILRTGGALLMPDGTVVGGEVVAVSGVEVRTLGSEASVTTKVSLASDVEASLPFIRIEEDLAALERERGILSLRLGPLAESLPTQEETAGLPDHVRLLVESFQSVIHRKEQLLSRRMQMLIQSKMRTTLRVNVLGIMYEGVEIFVSGRRFSPDTVMRGPFSIDFDIRKKRFSVGPVRALVRS